jgi:6-phosphogluconolactonase
VEERPLVSFQIEVFGASAYPAAAADIIAGLLPGAGGSLVLTGGTTAQKIYPVLAEVAPSVLGDLDILFSDERCVPPDDDESNFKMAADLLFNGQAPPRLHRMRGEDPPVQAAAAYSEEIRPLVDGGIDLLLLGMGADAHVGAMFPGSPALDETEQLCRAVDRPDGMQGLTLTPPAMLSAKTILLLVTGESKAATVRRVVQGDEPVVDCPARLLANHPDVTFLLDEPAASAL